MAEYGYDLGLESLKLFSLHESSKYNAIDQKNQEIDHLITLAEDLESFLSIVADRTDDSGRLDFTTQEEQARIDSLRERGLEEIFPHGKYSWQGKEIEALSRRIGQHIEGPLQRKIHFGYEEMMLEQNGLSRATELFASGAKRSSRLIERILDNITRAH